MLCLLSLGSVIFCAERPESPKARIVPYYSLENIAQLKPNEMSHAACTMILDPELQESPLTARNALTRDFAAAIQAGFFPILISSSLIYNLLHHPNEIFIPSRKALQDTAQWEIYNVKETSLILCVPHRYHAFYDRAGLQFSELLEPIDANTITEEFSNAKTKNSLGLKSLPLIFSPKEKKPFISWDFIIAGHGLHLKYIAGITFPEMQELLSFFDNHLNAGIVYISSCESGGQSISLLETDKQIPTSHRFILIVGSTSDAPVRLLFTKEFFETFFTASALVQDKGQTLSGLLRVLINISQKDIMGLPQIWLPGGIGFQSLQVSDFVEVIGNVNLQKHIHDKMPFYITNKAAVLIYPAHIPILMTVKPIKEQIGTTFIRTSKVPPNFTRWCTGESEKYNDVVIHFASKLNLFPIIKKLIKQETIGYFCHLFKTEKLLDQLPHPATLFPAFISMKHEVKEDPKLQRLSHQFAHIKLDLPESETTICGVLNFIRDAFLMPGTELSAGRSFIIDQLTGPNDIPFMMELMLFSKLSEKLSAHLKFNEKLATIAEKIVNGQSLENESDENIKLLEFTIKILYEELETEPNYDLYKRIPHNRLITLKNVHIDVAREVMRLSFEINGSGWICILYWQPFVKNEWQFRYADIRALYRATPLVELLDVPEYPQKELATVLKEQKALPEEFKKLRGSLAILQKGGVQTQHNLKQLQPSFNQLDELLKKYRAQRPK